MTGGIVLTAVFLVSIKLAVSYRLEIPSSSTVEGWFTGPDVCRKREIFIEPASEEDIGESIICSGDNLRYICTSRLRVGPNVRVTQKIFECCPGHVRAEQGCVPKNAQESEDTAKENTTPPIFIGKYLRL
ncbi:hypothetical protein JTE90_024905 [Oedothorax gibbosus]|uniref:Single domain-containing protein n=1 Tax=Oedothorax gibbosus TaxID=931172 RepID=A0AAV6U4A4_9ARAC|nr:hypothetical protein JTE90_024905 [Oedothorax gibbosus]